LKEEMDKVTAENPGIKLFSMGDYNDDPVSPSLKKHLAAVEIRANYQTKLLIIT
jgi:hypothetical protein